MIDKKVQKAFQHAGFHAKGKALEHAKDGTKHHAMKNLYKMGVKNKGEEETKKSMKTAFNYKSK